MVAVAALAVAAATAPGAWAAGELGLTVSGAPERLIVGDVATVTARVTNNDPLKTATAMRVNFNPSVGFDDPPNLTGPSCIAFPPPAISCAVNGNLAPGQSVDVQITSSLPAPTIAIAVGANADVLGDEFAPPMTAPFPYPQWQGVIEPKADIKLDLSANVETIPSGGSATFRALVTNTTAAGSEQAGVAYGAKVNLSIPPEVQLVSKPEDCTGTALRLTCPIGDLGAGLTAQRLITLRSTQPGAFTVLGSTTWDRPDTTIVDTQGQVTVTVLPPPDTSTPDPTPVTPTPTVSTKARASSFGTLVSGAPGTGRCIRSRRLSVVLRSIKNVDPVRATIRVTGRKRALVLKGTKARRPFSLKLPRSGRATVTLTVTLENGRRYTAKRTYRLC